MLGAIPPLSYTYSLGALPAFYPMRTGGVLSPGVKRPARETDHSPPSSAEAEECDELYLRSLNKYSWRGT
jgi:hypothetical protein